VSQLRIVADRNILAVEEAYAPHGEVVALDAARIDAAAVRDADLLLVRSTVRVNERLLAGSRVRFVATATAGTDHLDKDWLESRGIAWADAPGSNAPSVAEWFAAALLTLGARRRRSLAGLTVGVVGVGQVGSRVERVARAIGCEVLRCDPPRACAEGSAGFIELDELLAASDVVTLHVPLIREGPDATVRLLDGPRLLYMKPGAWLVNASRGEVVDGEAMLEARRDEDLDALALDVFPGEGEPRPPPLSPGGVTPELVAAADLATPHIAGHSLDGKAAGTQMILAAAARFLQIPPPPWTARASLPPIADLPSIDARTLDDEGAALEALRRFYRIEEDDAAMRAMAALPGDELWRAFRRYRSSYRVRREISGVRIGFDPPRPRAQAILAALNALPA
jgi:erythronate-4-phosphate dehydrogenase